MGDAQLLHPRHRPLRNEGDGHEATSPSTPPAASTAPSPSPCWSNPPRAAWPVWRVRAPKGVW